MRIDWCECRLAKERDLEGIDTSNIVSGDRRARRAAAVAAPINYAAIDKSSSSDEQGSSSEGASDASGSEGTLMASLYLSKLQPMSVHHEARFIHAPIKVDTS